MLHARQAFPEESYSVGLDENFEFGAEAVRLWYSSMTTPTQVRSAGPAARACSLWKRAIPLKADRT